ncbi:hypothetical protein QUB13_05670 [Microcoleus sp. B4-D4]
MPYALCAVWPIPNSTSSFARKAINILSYTYNWGDLVIQNPIWLARKIADILEPLGISYLVGGSVASSLLGENRATKNLDLIINILPQQAPQLICAMPDEFYISESAVFEAIFRSKSLPRKSSFNVIYLPAIEKAQLFVMSNDAPFSVSVMNRRQLHVTSAGSERGIYIYSAEDIILQKLCFYKQNGAVFKRQWKDVLGVVKVQGDRLNFHYLNEWGECLEVVDLLAQALQQSGLE